MVMKKKILLIVPPDNEQLIMERDKGVNDNFGTYAPLGLMYIATYLRDHLKDQIDIQVLDCTLGDWDYDKFEKEVQKRSPDLIGLSAFTPQILDVKIALEVIKKVLPSCVTVVGGPHINSFGKDALTFNEMDYGVMGYGEVPFLQLIKALFFGDAIENVSGLVYRHEDAIKLNPITTKKMALDDLPIPDRTFIEYDKYRCPVGTKENMVTMVSSRGCPFRCTFCNSPDKLYNARSMEKIIDEVKEIQALGVKEVFFYDDLFNITNERVFEFCDLLEKNKIKIAWAFKSRIPSVTEELVQRVKKAGCERIHFGIETHTDESLRTLKKGIKVAQIRNAVGLCQKYRINTVGSFMINLPGDTEQDILDRFAFVNSLKLDYAQYAITIAYNHTEIFDDGVKAGLWKEDLWLNYIKNPTADFVAPIWDNGISRERLDELLRGGLRSFYFRPSYFVQRVRNIHSLDEVKKYCKGAVNLVKLNMDVLNPLNLFKKNPIKDV
jgi:anaerobic magnesium-protoporphyrin IX monomethyl ester cyclase